jgi:hypothetical protein
MKRYASPNGTICISAGCNPVENVNMNVRAEGPGCFLQVELNKQIYTMIKISVYQITPFLAEGRELQHNDINNRSYQYNDEPRQGQTY